MSSLDCLSWRVRPAFLVAEANWTKEKPGDNVKASAGQGALATAASDPSGMGLVRAAFLEAVGMVRKGLLMGAASKENGAVPRAWGPGGGRLRCRLQEAELVLQVFQSHHDS